MVWQGFSGKSYDTIIEIFYYIVEARDALIFLLISNSNIP